MNNLKQMLRKHEGVKHYAYKCSAGRWTVGVGRNIDERGGIGLSDHEIDYMLENDIKRVQKELDNTFEFYGKLDPVRQDVMVDICFNLGMPRLLKFKRALEAMSLHLYDEAAKEFLDSRWARQVGKRSQRLATMLVTGEYENDA